MDTACADILRRLEFPPFHRLGPWFPIVPSCDSHFFRKIIRRELFFIWLFFPVGVRALSMDPRGVVPKIFSPNGDGINDVVFFPIDNDAEVEVSGNVLDCAGARVADLAPSPEGLPSPDSLYWDGRDEGGRLVAPGPYVYQIIGGGQVISGIVVVAR